MIVVWKHRKEDLEAWLKDNRIQAHDIIEHRVTRIDGRRMFGVFVRDDTQPIFPELEPVATVQTSLSWR